MQHAPTIATTPTSTTITRIPMTTTISTIHTTPTPTTPPTPTTSTTPTPSPPTTTTTTTTTTSYTFPGLILLCLLTLLPYPVLLRLTPVDSCFLTPALFPDSPFPESACLFPEPPNTFGAMQSLRALRGLFPIQLLLLMLLSLRGGCRPPEPPRSLGLEGQHPSLTQARSHARTLGRTLARSDARTHANTKPNPKP